MVPDFCILKLAFEVINPFPFQASNAHVLGATARLLPFSGFNCTCNEGYQHDTSFITPERFQNCTTHICGDGSLCHNMGECQQRNNGNWRCRCADGYTGTNCEERKCDTPLHDLLYISCYICKIFCSFYESQSYRS